MKKVNCLTDLTCQSQKEEALKKIALFFLQAVQDILSYTL